MNAKRILVIDDSATIRRLVDSYLSPDGYQVLLAGTAEEGLRLAREAEPELILLDHQLPGTTGFEVCRQLLELPRALQTPVVVSSTLRKRAYVEYADLPNVVDMLPKPYTAELLKTTVANALDTGALVVESQQHGTAVPEVLEAFDEPELSGTLRAFRLREVLDFLNNAGKCGVLEVESRYRRTYFAVAEGRVAAVNATGVEPGALSERLPEALKSLAPVLKLTVSGQRSAELDGIFELLDRKVLDPRLLRNLLRCQAALLTLDCFTDELRQFRFQERTPGGPLQRKLPLETSLPALLIDGALLCDPGRLPEVAASTCFARRTLRGQNLDRAGVAAAHMKLISSLAEPRTMEDLIRQSGLAADEVRRLLFGLTLAEVIEPQSQLRQLVVFENHAPSAQQLKTALEPNAEGFHARVVRDRLALQLVLKRFPPDVLVLGIDTEEAAAACRDVLAAERESLTRTRYLAAVPPDNQPNPRERWSAKLQVPLEAILARPYRADQLVQLLDRLPARGKASPARARGPAASPTPDLSRSNCRVGNLCAAEP